MQWAQMIIPASDRPDGLQELTHLITLVTNINRLDLRLETYWHQGDIHSKLSLDELGQLWERRWQEAVPLQYLLGVAHWRDLILEVTPAVLIPRPETEELIDLALQLTRDRHVPTTGHWLDLGTGSGAIALGLGQQLPQSHIHGVDASAEALAIAKTNIHRYGLQERITLYHGSWFQPLSHVRGKIEVIVSNPPYIPSSMIDHLQPEVKNHEPRLALDGGTDGLMAIKTLAIAAPDYLKPGGWLLMELMAGQGDRVISFLESLGQYSSLAIAADMNQIPRFLMAQTIA
nr:peptide chain release factor N(5)-glutamine methyltransferase [Candidatus Synechococcus calcipolaris]